MSWAKLFEELDKHGLLDRAATGIGYAFEDWATDAPQSDSKPGATSGATGVGSGDETASRGCRGPSTGGS